MIQVILFLGVHVLIYLDGIELTNVLYVGNIARYFEELIPATLWNVAFGEIFPGQFMFFLLLPVIGIVFLFRSRSPNRRKLSLAVFHISIVTWTIFPLLTTKLGVYRGP